MLDEDELRELTLEELRERKSTLASEIQDIEVQLADRNRTHEDGSRMTGPEYFDWRRSAATARSHRLKEIRQVNTLIRSLTSNEREQSLHEIHKKLDYIIEILEEEVEEDGDTQDS